MSSSALLSPLSLLSLLLFKISLAANAPYPFCPFNVTFGSNEPYANNLNKLIGYLNSSTPKTGFSSISVGKNQSQAYGLALCRGDINKIDCQTCIDEASIEIQKSCPNNKVAIIYYDLCQLKYANQNFLGQIDNDNWHLSSTFQNASDQDYFSSKVTELLGMLVEEVYVSTNLYAATELKFSFDSNITVYGLVQCTRDLPRDECKTCVDKAIIYVASYMHGYIDGIVGGGSCNVRFQISPFFNA